MKGVVRYLGTGTIVTIVIVLIAIILVLILAFGLDKMIVNQIKFWIKIVEVG